MTSTLRLSFAFGVMGVLALGACAAVSGLSALDVCSGTACLDGGGIGDDGPASADGAGTGDAGASDGDAGVTPEAGGSVMLACLGVTCAKAQVCCLGGAAPGCGASCPSAGITITCERTADCASNQVCCGKNWGFGDAGPGNSVCVAPGTCGDQGSVVLCDVDAGNTCGTDTCSGTKTIGGQVFHYCN